MSSMYDPSRDQNSLGGPTLPGGAGLDGGGSSGPMGPSMNGAMAFSGASLPVTSAPDAPAAPSVTPADPAAPIPAKPPAPTVTPSAPGGSTPSNPSIDPAMGYAPPGAQGTSGGALVPMGGAGLDGGGGSGPLNTPMGPTMAFADGGAVEDPSQDEGADTQGAMGNDPVTQMISAAMDSVDKTFQYGRQKNGLMQGGQQQAAAMPTKPGQQSDTPNSQQAPPQGTLSQNSNDGDADDMPGANVASNDGDEDDRGAA